MGEVRRSLRRAANREELLEALQAAEVRVTVGQYDELRILTLERALLEGRWDSQGKVGGA